MAIVIFCCRFGRSAAWLFNVYGLENSVWAWKVCDATGVPVSINKILKENNVKVSVVNRVIKVEGVDVYSLYNDEGIRLKTTACLNPEFIL